MRVLPDQIPRVETGPVKFGDDWCGTFVRGDDSFFYAMVIRQVISGESHPANLVFLENLANLLGSSTES